MRKLLVCFTLMMVLLIACGTKEEPTSVEDDNAGVTKNDVSSDKGESPTTDVPSSFSYLTELQLDYDRIYYNPELSKVLNYKLERNGWPSGPVRLIETRLNSTRNEIYTIEFDPGPSADPSFNIYLNEDEDLIKIGSLPGDRLYVPGNGFIYISGSTNNFFLKRNKYVLQDDELVEVPQPFYYVGLKSMTGEPVTFYSDRDLKQVIARLPEGSEVEVLLSVNNSVFLLKTPFGLVGWARLRSGQCGMKTTVKGICYHGD